LVVAHRRKPARTVKNPLFETEARDIVLTAMSWGRDPRMPDVR
jgi:hypothetical protein